MRISKLRNGITVVTECFPSAASVAVEIGVNYGSIDVTPKTRGMAHLIEHMLFKGTRRRGWKQIRDEIEKRGGYMNAYTTHEMTAYHALLPREHLSVAIDVLSDIFANPLFDEDEFEKEKAVVISEQNRIYDSPSDLIHFMMPTLLYRKHPVRLSFEKKEITKSFTRKQAAKAWKNNYVGVDTTVVVTGNVSHSRVVKEIVKRLGRLRHGTARKRAFPADSVQEKKVRIVSRKGLKESQIIIGYKTCRITDMERFAVEVMADILSVRLFDEIREKRGLSFSPHAGERLSETFGYIFGYANASPEKEDEAKHLILDEIRIMHDGEITEKEAEERKDFLANSYGIRVERTDEAADEIIDNMMLGRPELYKGYPNEIRKVTLKQVKAAARKYLSPDRYAMLIIRPERSKRKGR